MLIPGFLNIFLSKVYNKLVYDWEISGFLIASLLLNFPKYYTLLLDIKSSMEKQYYSCFNKFVFDH